MTGNEKIPWRRLSVEAAAIVGSILLAFAIDAWWEERQERRAEEGILDTLQKEFSANYDLLDEWKERCTAFCGAERGSNQVYEMIEQALAAGITTIEVLDSQLDELVGAGTFEAETPVLDGLIQSGQLAIVQDQRVSSAIAIWDRFLRDSVELQVRARQNIDRYLIPALIERGDVGHVLRNHAFQLVDEGVDFSGVTTLAIDLEFKGIIAQRSENAIRISFTIDRVQRAAGDVLAAIYGARSDADSSN
jgi:hypothetical protein